MSLPPPFCTASRFNPARSLSFVTTLLLKMANIVTAFFVLVFVAGIVGRHAAGKSTGKVTAAPDNEDVTTPENLTVTSDGSVTITDKPDAGGSGGGAWASVQAFWREHRAAILGTAGFLAALFICCRCCCCKNGALFSVNMPYSRVVNSRG